MALHTNAKLVPVYAQEKVDIPNNCKLKQNTKDEQVQSQGVKHKEDAHPTIAQNDAGQGMEQAFERVERSKRTKLFLKTLLVSLTKEQQARVKTYSSPEGLEGVHAFLILLTIPLFTSLDQGCVGRVD